MRYRYRTNPQLRFQRCDEEEFIRQSQETIDQILESISRRDVGDLPGDSASRDACPPTTPKRGTSDPMPTAAVLRAIDSPK